MIDWTTQPERADHYIATGVRSAVHMKDTVTIHGEIALLLLDLRMVLTNLAAAQELAASSLEDINSILEANTGEIKDALTEIGTQVSTLAQIGDSK